ncbi:GNAT family N-acetyltransferase [Fundidesulfovibrio agrisoli]|uniref:GNAT family N-acetyltransferase n=1 Tax=Fundidesulfovibrio agrisoli TaxID=2922717 RepID=UPI001FADEA28|nr:GNAT family N-acetyltransferase [Fundidesulfovibrio agrisoli]
MPVNNTEPLSVYAAGPGYAPCLAAMILDSSRAHRLRGFIEHILDLPKPKALRLLARLAAHPAQLCGRIGNAYVALVDGVCSGMVTVRPAGRLEEFPFSPEALAEAGAAERLGGAWLEGALKRQRAFTGALAGARGPAPAGTWSVEYLAVRYENRSAGVARALLGRVAAEVRDAGGNALELYCEAGNLRAEAMCSALGFEPAGPPGNQEAWSLRLMRKAL